MQGERLGMIIKNKLKLILNGIIVPYIIYTIIVFFVAALFIVLKGDNEINVVFVQGISNVVSLVVLLPIYVIFRKNNRINNYKIIVLRFFYLIAMSFAICIIGNILADFIPHYGINKVTEEISKMTEEYNIGVTLVIVTIFIPILEELLFRGFFYDTIKLISNDIIAIILSSIAFAIAHWDLRQSLYALFAGVFIAYIKYKYNSIIYTIFMHLFMNFTSMIFISTLNLSSDFRQKIFILFISFSILILSLIRINHNRNIS